MARHRFPAMQARCLYLSMDMDDPPVDFGAAGLYLVGLQTVLCTVVSLPSASCHVGFSLDAHFRGADLAITSAVALAMMKSPIRLGRVRGVLTMFNALRPLRHSLHFCARRGATRAHVCLHGCLHGRGKLAPLRVSDHGCPHDRLGLCARPCTAQRNRRSVSHHARGRARHCPSPSSRHCASGTLLRAGECG